ncbi:zf-HC2 domain-containing protein [Sneathiella glossodoripedis]|uniref:zf-HC2 domain-containing protein n=1 Tax=Sneathiella glossodoripedis TaxID=418853 RepID=UPI000471C170|nr:zf-HC2 domain-containing protein [Sneathiella glossodoripedis]
MSRKIEELLPFYVNNTLDETERAEVEKALDNSERLREELEILRKLRSEMQQIELEQSPGEFGLKRLQNSLKSEIDKPSAEIANDNRSAVFWRVGAVAACLLLAIQTVMFVPDWSGEDLDAASGVSVQPHGVLYSITFAPDAREENMRSLMLSLNARFVDGPSVLVFTEYPFQERGKLCSRT